jgi:type II pantothenate kinase
LTKTGDNGVNDLLIKNINPGHLSPAEKKSEGDVAVSFGKVMKNQKLNSETKEQDVVKSLLYMTTYNLSQIAFQELKRQNLERVFFSGSFIRGNEETFKCITNAFEYFSNVDGVSRQVRSNIPHLSSLTS